MNTTPDTTPGPGGAAGPRTAPGRGALLLAMVVAIGLVLGGCETQQSQPVPPPQTTRAPAGTEAPSEEQAAEAPAAHAGEVPDTPASRDAAEVEITEIPDAADAPPDSEEGDQRPGAAMPTTAGAAGGEHDPERTGPVMSIGGAKTDEERGAALTSRLNSGLSEFDEMIDQQRAASGQAASAETAAAGTGSPRGADDGRGSRIEPPADRRGAGGQASVGTGQGNTPDLSGEARRGDGQQVATGPIPQDIPDARDDDIVARQLREAAMKETDPVLREKLWEEYRKYKKGLGSR